MKHVFTTLTFLLLSILSFSQANNYDQGFQTGYKEGYCYNDYGCIGPIPPFTPIPLVGESYDSYQDGYNRGFKMGLENKGKDKVKNSNGNNSNNTSSGTLQPQKYQSTYVSPDFDAIMQAGAAMQARYDQNKQLRDNMIDWIFELKSQTNDKEFLIAMEKYYKQLRALDGKDFGALGNELDIIKLNIKEEIDKYNTRIKKANDPENYFNKAVELSKNGNYAAAIIEATKVIEVAPNNGAGYYLRGTLYFIKREYAKSISDFSKCIELSPSVNAYKDRGWCYNYSGNYIAAIADFNKVIEMEPNNEAGYFGRGYAKSNMGDYFGGNKDYEKTIELNPKHSMAYNNLGWNKFEKGDLKSALDYVNKAIVADYTNSTAFDSRAEIRFNLSDYEGAMGDCNMAISLNPKIANAFFIRGRCNYKQGVKNLACEDWSKAGELGKTEAYDYLTKYCK